MFDQLRVSLHMVMSQLKRLICFSSFFIRHGLFDIRGGGGGAGGGFFFSKKKIPCSDFG